jgi:clan AA aspartic protease
MGLIYADVQLTNVRDADLAPIVVHALVDSGALHLCIPETVALQLNLEELERRQVTIASGASMSVPYVGPVKVSMGNRSCFTGAMVLGNQTLLGAIPMEDMDLVVHPATQKVAPNPASPNIPASVAMGVRHSRRK